jgi:hypothetical protein
MVRVHWATSKQTTFLTARMEAFLNAQTQHKLIPFYMSTCNAFFKWWLEREHLFPTPGNGEAPQLTTEQSQTLKVVIIKRKHVSHLIDVDNSFDKPFSTANQVVVLMALKVSKI